MRRAIAIAAAIAVGALALTGCGASAKSQKEIGACWNQQLSSYIQEKAHKLGADPNGIADYIGDTALLYEAGTLKTGDAFPGSQARFKVIEQQCGHAHVVTKR